MKLEGDYIFDAPQDLVWKALQDPDVLSSAMPGGEGFHETGENEYSGNLKVKVGPVQGVFKGKIKLEDIIAPESYKMIVDGKGAPGFVKATGSLKLSPDGENRTHMEYSGEAKVGGRIASVGQRLMDASAKSIVRQSLEGLNEYLKVQVAAQEAGAGEEDAAEAAAIAEVPEYKPPSQTAVAANVAKDVVGDLIPPKYRPVVIGLVILVILIILYFLLT